MALPNPKLQVKTTKAAAMNCETYNDYYQRLRSLALSIFKWNGLPDSVSERFMEQTLFERGQALFFYDTSLGFLVLPCTASGPLNVYHEPIRYHAYSTLYTKEYQADNCVLIRNNYDAVSTMGTINLFATRLMEAERTIDTNIALQKMPFFIVCEDKLRLTMLNLYKQISTNEVVILGNKTVSLEDIKSIKTETPFIADKLMDYKHSVWNEAMTFLGLDNANTDKKERLITDEVTANNETIQMSAHTMLLTRQEACEKINKMYNLKISVELRADIIREDLQQDLILEQPNTGGDENE